MFEWLKKYFRREKINANLVKEVLVVNDRLMELSKIMDEYYELLYEFNKETLPGNEFLIICTTPTDCWRVKDLVEVNKQKIYIIYEEANDAAFNCDDDYCEKISLLNKSIDDFKKYIDLIKLEVNNKENPSWLEEPMEDELTFKINGKDVEVIDFEVTLPSDKDKKLIKQKNPGSVSFSWKIKNKEVADYLIKSIKLFELKKKLASIYLGWRSR